MKKKYELVGVSALAPLTVFLGWPTWQASSLASSRANYLIWSAGQSLVSTAIIVGVLALLWGRSRKVSTALAVCGLVALVFGLSLRASAPLMFERAAPELTSAGSGIWVSTTIREHVSSGRGYLSLRSALAAEVKRPDGSVLEVLTTNRYDRTGHTVQLLQDRNGVIWAAIDAGDHATINGSMISVLGLVALVVGLSAKISWVQAYARRKFDEWLSEKKP